MAWFKVAVLLVAGAGALSTNPVSRAAGNISVDVDGMGGRFAAYRTKFGPSDPQKVVVLLDSLREVDANGMVVGTGESIKHSVQTFAGQDFRVTVPEEVIIGTAAAKAVSFSSAVGASGQLKVDTLLLTQPGVVGPEADKWNASVGDLKWSIELSSWAWCGCTLGGTEQVGAFIDVLVWVLGSNKNATQRSPGNNKTYDLGNGVTMELTNRILLDGVEALMPAGYPRLEARNSSQVFVFRFPKFSTSAVYDPLVRLSGVRTESTTVTTTASKTTTAFVNTSGLLTTAAGISVRVHAQSGRFTAYSAPSGESDPNKVVAVIDALREVDAKGNAVGAGDKRHSIQSFATQAFNINLPYAVTVGSTRATNVSFSSRLGSFGRVKVDTLILTKPGMVGPERAEWAASAGDLKWNIELSSWSWCGWSRDCMQQRGAYIDVDIVVKGKGQATQAASGNNTYDLGGGITMELTNRIELDGVDTVMPPGYPLLENRGSTQVFILRFPKFDNSAVYDPLLRMSGSDSFVKPTSTSTPPPTVFVNHGAGLGDGRMVWAMKTLALVTSIAISAGFA